MAPKSTTTQPQKLAKILNYFHSSGVAHNFRELEKALPSIASINGMQVKDYLQALTDENKINCEKIGTGNWYWSFAGEEGRLKRESLEKARKEKSKLEGTLAELKDQLASEEERLANEDEEVRRNLTESVNTLEEEVRALKKELEDHKDSDPVEIERRQKEVEELKNRTERWTDDILEMERYLKVECGLDRESLLGLKRELYGDEFEEDEQGLRELCA